jgi:hypothetical protein
MVFTRVALVLCGTGLLAGLLADTLFFSVSRLLGGFSISAKPSGWIGLFLIGWMFVFVVGWSVARSFSLLPYR